MRRTSTTSISGCKPLCVVCKNAGKSEREYSSHFVKNIDGIVVCPIIKATTCTYCSKKGHISKYCNKRERDEKLATKQQQQSSRMRSKPCKKEVASVGFSVLSCDDEETLIEDITLLDKYIEEEKTADKRGDNKMSFREALTTLKPTSVEEPKKDNDMVELTKEVMKSMFSTKMPSERKRRIINWADSDSDDDEEDNML